MRKPVILFVMISVLLVVWFLFYQEKNNDQDPKDIKTVKSFRGDISKSISATGRLNPARTVAVGSQVSGTIKKIYVDYNSIIKVGQIIVKLDSAMFDAQVRQSRANVDAAKAHLNIAIANLQKDEAMIENEILEKGASLKKNKAEFIRLENLYNQRVISETEIGNASEAYELSSALYNSAMARRTEIDVRKSEIDAARASLAHAEASLMLSETNLSYTTITSPMNGIVIGRNVDEGQTVAASLSAPTLMTIGDLNTMEIKVSVDEADIGQIKTGQDTSFTVDAYPDRRFQGKVSKIYLAPVIIQNVVTYDVIVSIDNSDKLLMPGMTANAAIMIEEKKGVIAIPNSALRLKIPVSGDKKSPERTPPGMKRIWVQEKSIIKPRNVITGISDDQHTEILQGLGEGEVVVIENGKSRKSHGGSASPFRSRRG